MNSKLYKLAKMVLNLAEIETDKAKLIIDGEAEVGKEVFVEDENGELVAPEDGEYATESQIFLIVDGKIAEIREKEEVEIVEPEPEAEPDAEPEEPLEIIEEEQPEEPAEEEAPAEDEKDAEIAKLQAQIEELNNIIAEKDEEIGKLKAELESSDSQPAEELLKSQKEIKKSWFKPRF